MRSGELASLAGVSVRALRHYHQVGVLPEPARRANGYRRYDVGDLVRVLRIKRMAALGIPLERMPELLDGEDGDGDDLVDQLAGETDAEIARLTERRRLIESLRSHRSAPDVPPELAPFLAAPTGVALSPAMRRIERDQSILLAHLAGPTEMPQLVRAYDGIAAVLTDPEVAALNGRFDRLTAEAPEEAVQELVDAFVTVLLPIVRELEESVEGVSLNEDLALSVLHAHAEETLNAAQWTALARIEQRIGRDLGR